MADAAGLAHAAGGDEDDGAVEVVEASGFVPGGAEVEVGRVKKAGLGAEQVD